MNICYIECYLFLTPILLFKCLFNVFFCNPLIIEFVPENQPEKFIEMAFVKHFQRYSNWMTMCCAQAKKVIPYAIWLNKILL